MEASFIVMMVGMDATNLTMESEFMNSTIMEDQAMQVLSLNILFSYLVEKKNFLKRLNFQMIMTSMVDFHQFKLQELEIKTALALIRDSHQ